MESDFYQMADLMIEVWKNNFNLLLELLFEMDIESMKFKIITANTAVIGFSIHRILTYVFN